MRFFGPVFSSTNPTPCSPLTFNPIRSSLLDRLPQSEQSKMPTVEARYADTPGIGAFDVRLVYNDEFPSDVDVNGPGFPCATPPRTNPDLRNRNLLRLLSSCAVYR